MDLGCSLHSYQALGSDTGLNRKRLGMFMLHERSNSRIRVGYNSSRLGKQLQWETWRWNRYRSLALARKSKQFTKHHGSRFKLKKDSKHHISVYGIQAVSGPCDVFPESTGKCIVRPLQGEVMQALALIRRQARQHHQKETQEGLQNTKT